MKIYPRVAHSAKKLVAVVVEQYQRSCSGFSDVEKLKAAKALATFLCSKKTVAAAAATTTAVVASSGSLPTVKSQLSPCDMTTIVGRTMNNTDEN